jgi:hypothetical protein
MSQSNLKQITEELEKSLAAATPPPPKTPQAPPKPEHPKTDFSKAEALTPIVRAVVEYTLHRAGESRTAAQIGEAIGLGIQAASKELNLNEASLVKALDAYLAEVAQAAKKVIPSS